MLSVVLALLLGLVLGFIGGVVVKTMLKPRNAPKDILDQTLEDFIPKEKAEFIKINPVEQFLKETEGDIPLDTVIDYE